MSSGFLPSRRFNFFDISILKDPQSKQEFDQLKDIDLTCWTSGRGYLIFGDASGYIYFYDRQLRLHLHFQAHEFSVQLIFQFKQYDLLITVGIDRDDNEQCIKLWKMEGSSATCSRLYRPLDSNRAVNTICPQITCLDAHENLSYMAVGYDNGFVELHHGDITRERHCKVRVLHECPRRVTCIALKMVGANVPGLSAGTSGNLVGQLCVYVATEGSILSIFAGRRQQKDVKHVLDQHGCLQHCASLTDAASEPDKEPQFVVGIKNGVYFYQSDGRGACLAIDGDRQQLYWFRNYLLLVDRHSNSVGADNISIGSGGGLLDGDAKQLVCVYDVVHKFTACSAPLPPVLGVLSEWNSIYVVCANKKVYHLQEKDTHSKLEILFRKKSFQLMIDIAKRQGYDQDGFADIYRRYGDYLLKKGDHDGAIEEYKKTIGKLEASYVIHRFLDSAHIHNLASYLQELHQRKFATEDHTTLLLNCYTKLRDEEELNKFVMANNDSSMSINTKDSSQSLAFDVDTAIRVLRQAGYYKQALKLARRCHCHAWVLSVLLENLYEYSEALTYLRQLDGREALDNVERYGKVLLHAEPRVTTDLLITLYERSEWQPVELERVMTIFVNHREELIRLLEYLVERRRRSNSGNNTAAPDDSAMCNTLLELYLAQLIHDKDPNVRSEHERRAQALLEDPSLRFDQAQALVLCQTHGFKDGFLFLCERAAQYDQILQMYMESKEDACVLQTCEKFGQQNTNLWVQALAYFAKRGDIARRHLDTVLAHVEEHALLPPLLVVQLLAVNSEATIASVKDYICRMLRQDNLEIEECEKDVARLQAETEEMRSKVHELRTNYKLFQANKCKVCNLALDVPSVHFLCDHSYHQHCFESYAEREDECPVCAPENRRTLQAISLWSDAAGAVEQSNQLFEDLRSAQSNEGFRAVAACLAKGIFNKDSVATQPDIISVPKVTQAEEYDMDYVPFSSDGSGARQRGDSSNQSRVMTSKAVAPQVASKVIPLTAPKVIPPVAPKVIPPVASKVIPPVAPKVIPPVASKVIQPVASKVLPSAVPKLLPSAAAPRVLPQTAPKVVPQVKSNKTSQVMEAANSRPGQSPLSTRAFANQVQTNAAEQANPFGEFMSPDEEDHDLGVNNPFASESGVDYPEKLNPF